MYTYVSMYIYTYIYIYIYIYCIYTNTCSVGCMNVMYVYRNLHLMNKCAVEMRSVWNLGMEPLGHRDGVRSYAHYAANFELPLG